MAETSIRNLSGEASTLNDNAYLVVADTDNNTKKIKGSVIKAEAAAAASSVAVRTGTIAHGAQIPLPAGFTEAECKWIVTIYSISYHYDSPGHTAASFNVYTGNFSQSTPSRYVTIGGGGDGEGTAWYMIIGIK